MKKIHCLFKQMKKVHLCPSKWCSNGFVFLHLSFEHRLDKIGWIVFLFSLNEDRSSLSFSLVVYDIFWAIKTRRWIGWVSYQLEQRRWPINMIVGHVELSLTQPISPVGYVGPKNCAVMSFCVKLTYKKL